MDSIVEDRPFVSIVRRISRGDNGTFAWFDGKAAVYRVPDHLIEIVEAAAQDNREIKVTMDQTRILTFEFQKPSAPSTTPGHSWSRAVIDFVGWLGLPSFKKSTPVQHHRPR